MVGVVACVPLRTSVVVDFSNENWYLEGYKTVLIFETLFCITGADESMDIFKIEAGERPTNWLALFHACH